MMDAFGRQHWERFYRKYAYRPMRRPSYRTMSAIEVLFRPRLRDRYRERFRRLCLRAVRR